MTRILLLIKGLGRGGAEQLLVNAAPYLDHCRFQHEVAYLLPHKNALVKELAAAGVPATCLDGARGLGWVGRLTALVRRRRIELVHTHSPYPAALARAVLRLPLVHTEHNVWHRYHPATYWGNLVTFARNGHVFTVSDEVRASIAYPAALHFLKMPPVETLYHGPDRAALQRRAATDGVRRELGIPATAPLIGTIANFKEHKGHSYLLQAALLVRDTIPDVRFVLVGVGQLEERIRREAADLGLGSTVVFAGFREDAPRVASSFDLFVLPSLHEGLPISLVEAMALGKASVATTAGGIPEVVEDMEHGLLVPPKDPVALAGAIVRLIADRELRDRLGAAARRRAEDFDIRVAVRRQQELYEELLG